MADPALPSGIVTFLFSDIEGSTRLFRDLGDRYPEVLEVHNQVLRAIWTQHAGVEVFTEGDSFVVAFDSADRAVLAAASGQRALAGVDWPHGVALKVRMGLHSGLAAPRGNGYVSITVHQASRVIGVAHGGQIVVSQDTAFLTPRELEVALRPLGRFRLRDFTEPVRLYQVVGQGLEEHFAAPRAIPADKHNIVGKQTPTIGREETLAALVDHVVPGQLLTLVGPGGVGKSRTATELGLAIAPRWEDGVWLVELAGVSEPDLVAGAVADAVGAPARADGARADDVVSHLESLRAVVILDNCEHLIAACREMILRIHAGCEHVAIIATSREPLHSPGEVRWPIEPLEVPEDSASAEAIFASPAVELFGERGIMARPGFEIDRQDAVVVAEIVRHLDGLPLLIELAAALLSVQTPREILEGLQSSARYLRSRDPHTSERHRTIEGLLTWSYRLLGPAEQSALRRLSVFAAGFNRASAAAAMVGEDIGADETDDLLWSLVDRSLIGTDFDTDETRYHLLETVRTYARQRLDQAGETDAVATRLAEWYLERLGPWLPPDRGWVSDVRDDLDNLRAIVGRIPRSSQELAQQIACSIGRYHDATQTFQEGIQELTRLAGLLDEPSATRVSLLATLGYLHLRGGQVEQAARLIDAAEALSAEHGSPEWDDVAIERTRGEITRRVGDLSGAVKIARDALEKPVSDRGRARMYNLLATASGASGDLETALDAGRAELELNRKLGYEGYVASAHGNLAETALRLGDMPAAAGHQRACLELAVALGSPVNVAFSLIVAARIAGWQLQWDTAVTIHAKAEEELDKIGLVLYDDDLAESRQLLEVARRELGEKDFESSRNRGLEMSLPDAVRAADHVLATAQHMKGADL
jgi:predicted ATPase/class 3 adenylate cyclase